MTITEVQLRKLQLRGVQTFSLKSTKHVIRVKVAAVKLLPEAIQTVGTETEARLQNHQRRLHIVHEIKTIIIYLQAIHEVRIPKLIVAQAEHQEIHIWLQNQPQAM